MKKFIDYLLVIFTEILILGFYDLSIWTFPFGHFHRFRTWHTVIPWGVTNGHTLPLVMIFRTFLTNKEFLYKINTMN